MKLVKTLCILCVGASLVCASDDEVRPGTPPYPAACVSSASVPQENQNPLPVLGTLPSEPTAAIGRHTPEIGEGMADSGESDNDSVAVSGNGEDESVIGVDRESNGVGVEGANSSNPESPLMMVDPVLDSGKSPVHSDFLAQKNKKDHHMLRKSILMSMSFVLHATMLFDLLSNPVNLCEGFWTKTASYVCLANSCVFSLIASGYAPEFVHMYSQYVFIVPMMVLVYASAQKLQCAFDAG
ncbi:MAG TPA: hypothetical protein DIC42_06465 [Holosporales bacterium]|nr:hypothetical protein [Holosporales bacterium]